MDLHTLTNTEGARHRIMRVGRGRGSGKGKTCGRGTKGQMSRSGHKHKPTFEGGQMRLVRRLPKRGFTNPCPTEYQAVNVSSLNAFDEGSVVTVEAVRQAGLANGTIRKIKVLGRGDLERKLTVKAHAFSASARQKIETAGGTCEQI